MDNIQCRTVEVKQRPREFGQYWNYSVWRVPQHSMCQCNIILLSCPRAKCPEINGKLHANFYQNMDYRKPGPSTHTRDKGDFPPIIYWLGENTTSQSQFRLLGGGFLVRHYDITLRLLHPCLILGVDPVRWYPPLSSLLIRKQLELNKLLEDYNILIFLSHPGPQSSGGSQPLNQ